MTNECEGCGSFRPYKVKGRQCGDDSILHLSKTDQCPCSICIVKPICSDGCEDFQKYKKLCEKEMFG